MSRGCFVGVRFNGVTLSYDIDSIRQADIVSGRIVWRLIKRELGTSTTISAQIILP
jgi:hypothetical protein